MSSLVLEEDMRGRDATEIARAYEPGIAWPTLILAFVTGFGYWEVVYAGASGVLPLWVAFSLNVVLSFVCYTPLHEACHGNVAQKSHRLAWLNTVVGILASGPYLHNFHMHQVSHLAHHANTNDPERDPDHGVASSSVMELFLRSWTLVFIHSVWSVRLCRRRADGRRRMVLAAFQTAFWLALVLVMAVRYNSVEVLTITVLASWVGSALLAVTFDWLPHHPHLSRERWKHTRMLTFPGPVQRVLDVVLLGQTYHLVHHLYPRVPYFRYKAVFHRLDEFFRSNGARIYPVGHPPTELAPSD